VKGQVGDAEQAGEARERVCGARARDRCSVHAHERFPRIHLRDVHPLERERLKAAAGACSRTAAMLSLALTTRDRSQASLSRSLHDDKPAQQR
jgi:hypothetical protein